MERLNGYNRAVLFFKSVRQQKGWGITATVVFLLAIGLMRIPMGTDTFFYKSLMATAVLTGILVAFWLSSYALLPLLRRRRTAYAAKRQQLLGNMDRQNRGNSSERLSPAQKKAAQRRLDALQKESDYCFLRGEESYLRVQWLSDKVKAVNGASDKVYIWNTACFQFSVNYDGDICYLTIEKVNNGGAERVFARWTPPNPRMTDQFASEKVELLKDQPILFSYEEIFEWEDGSKELHDEHLCAITWIGGKQ